MLQIERWASPTQSNGSSEIFCVSFSRPVQVVPDHLCCLKWAIDLKALERGDWLKASTEGLERWEAQHGLGEEN